MTLVLVSAIHPFLASWGVRAGIDEFYPTDHQWAVIVLGQPDFTSTAEATTQTGMKLPHAVMVDPTTGKVFVAEPYNHRMLRFASVSEFSNGAAAQAVLGKAELPSGP